MGKFKVEIFPAAKSDLLEMIEYLNTLSPEVAIKQYDSIINKVSTLTEMPQRCPLLKTNELRQKGYRTFFIDNYIVFYVIKDNVVEIRRILYGKRQYEFLL